jgi:pyruvate,orthophosphate dikinase
MDKKYVYSFGEGLTEGKADMKDLLGGKGASLAEMASLGISVPPGFTITTEAYRLHADAGNRMPRKLWAEISEHMSELENRLDKKFGDAKTPLLVSVRSGARVSMPGMMDTVLNLGLNLKTTQGLGHQTGNPRFALDCHRRFIQMFGNVALGVDSVKFETLIAQKKKRQNLQFDTDLTAQNLETLIDQFRALVKKNIGEEFPTDPTQQLKKAIQAVFLSWNTQRAITYRKLNHIPDDWGTAVTVQAMVFGNMGSSSGTGVAFTRNPATGEKKFYGEYLMNAQGEDVVAGIRTPNPIAHLEAEMPEAYESLVGVYQKLENHYLDMQDLEFTIENGHLYMLQTRAGKRTVSAAIKIAMDMVQEGLISKQEALMRIPADQMDQVFHPTIDPKSKVRELARGLGASPGAATGKIVFTPERAEELAGKKERVILVRMETSPEDIHGMSVAEGILTARGGMTSHAAVVARSMGKPCVSGCADLDVDVKKKKCKIKGTPIKELEIITLDGSTGRVMPGAVPLIRPRHTSNITRMMSWAGETRTLKIRANADTPHDAFVARNFGAEGIGLCRTEHMFFGEDRILLMRKMILTDDPKKQAQTLKLLLPIQRGDFTQIFKVMEGLPVTIRLLDPPLHEFLPNTAKEIKILAKDMKLSQTALTRKIGSMRETNPMLGLRGCRLGIVFPEIYRMQVRAIIEAAARKVKKGLKVFPEIMIPLVSHVNEFITVRDEIVTVANEVIQKAEVKLSYKIGTMIELPRAAITADEIAAEADFFSFGTNDLTQTTFGLSRDDAGSFLSAYIENGVLAKDPFVTVDKTGVGSLVKMAAQKGKSVNPGLHLGVCGEHGGDPASIELFHTLGLDYVSCSPYRVPTAILSAAQAAIKHR